MAKPVKPKRKSTRALPELAIDFDGVIHDGKNPVEGKKMGAPMEGCVNAMQNLEDDFTLVVHTVMAKTAQGKQVVEDWLKYYHVPYNRVTAEKPNAVLFLDDRALRFTDWVAAQGEIYRLVGPDEN
jgi:hypothetical protein